MKRVFVLMTIAAFLMAGVFTSCKNEAEKEKAKQKQKQEAFEKHLSSYPAGFPEFGSALLKNYDFGEKSRPGKLTLKKGMEIAYKYKGKKLSGELPQDIVCLRKDGKTVMANCSRVVYHGKASTARFTVGPFEDGPWDKESLDPFARKYQLTITSWPDSKGHTGPAYETYEEFADVSPIGHPQFQVLDVLKEIVKNDDERLETFIKFNGKYYLYRADDKEWGRR